MVERIYTVETIQKGDDQGNLMVMLRDNELDSTIMMMLPSDAVSKLAAFPGSSVKIIIEKV